MWPTDDPQPDNLLDAVLTLQRQAEGLCDPTATQCRGDCCHAMESAGGRVVAVALPDLIALAAYLDRPCDSRSLRRAVSRLVEEHCTLSPFTGTYMLTGKGSCPFLDESDTCTVYAVRPLLCRVFFHCEWVGERLRWDAQLDDRVLRLVLDLALDMGRLWEGHAGLLWRQPWRYDLMPLPQPPEESGATVSSDSEG